MEITMTERSYMKSMQYTVRCRYEIRRNHVRFTKYFTTEQAADEFNAGLDGVDMIQKIVIGGTNK